MKIFYFTILLLIPLPCFCDDRDRAVRHIQKAVLQYPVVKRYTKKLQKKALDYIPLEKRTIGIIGGTVASAVKGSVNTRVIKKMDIDLWDAKMRPDIEYNFRENTVGANVSINWSF